MNFVRNLRLLGRRLRLSCVLLGRLCIRRDMLVRLRLRRSRRVRLGLVGLWLRRLR